MDNREDPHANFVPYDNEADALKNFTLYQEESAYYQSLAGDDWKFYWVSKPADAPSSTNMPGFYKLGYDDSAWDDITVPGNWQVNWNEDSSLKYDMPIYVNTAFPWPRHGNTAFSTAEAGQGRAPKQFNSVGTFRRNFTVPSRWKAENKSVYLNYKGVESNCYVWVNGKYVGYAEDSFTDKFFDITPFIDYDGENVLTTQVYRWSSGSYFENQDFLRLSGIFRDVALIAHDKVTLYDFEAVPSPAVEGVYDGDWNLDVSSIVRSLEGATADMRSNVRLSLKLYECGLYNSGDTLVAETGGDTGLSFATVNASNLSSPDTRGQLVSKAYLGATQNNRITIKPKLWSAEKPNLYKLVLTLKQGEETVETTCVRVGFRDARVVGSGDISQARLLVNGSRVLIYGVNYHEIDPLKGRTLSLDLMRKDIEMMKQFNINAVRMSHYPHDVRFYDLADEYGLYITEEANIENHNGGIGGNSAAVTNTWGPMLRDRLSNMYERTKNHASIITWSYGNEIYNVNAAAFISWCNDWLRDRRADNRPTQASLGGTNQISLASEIYAEGYTNPTTQIADILGTNNRNPAKRPTVMHEYAHAMGNSNGNLDEYIDIFNTYPSSIGGFIWEWVDHSLLTPMPPDMKYEGYGYDAIHPDNEIYNVNGDYVNAPDGYDGVVVTGGGPMFSNLPDYELTEDITVDCLIYPQSRTSGTNFNILAKGGDNQFTIKETGSGTSGNIEWFVYGNGAWTTATYRVPTDYYNKWHRLIGTFARNPEGSGGTLVVYLDGEEVARQTTGGTIVPNPVYGISVGTCAQNTSRRYNGYIAQARVLGRAMSAAEISALSKTDYSTRDDSEVFRFVPPSEIPSGPTAYPSKTGLTEYYAFGGDWGDNPDYSGNFCTDGMMLPDRTPYPQTEQVRYSYRMITADLKNSAEYTVTNRFQHTNVDEFDMSWKLFENDKVIQSGTGVLNVGPAPAGISATTSTSVDFEVPYTAPDVIKPGAEYFFKVDFALREDTAWAKAGYVISESQLPVTDFSVPISLYNVPKGSLNVEESATAVDITGDDFAVSIAKSNGKITSYKFKERDLLLSGPEPNFWRPLNDNEWASVANGLNTWKTVGSARTTTDVAVSQDGNTAIITVNGALGVKTGSTYTTTYTIYKNGAVEVDYCYAFPSMTSNQYVQEIGSIMTVKPDFENLTWFGRKGETYSDRKTGGMIGLWEGKVADQFFPYFGNQETGTKVDTRWMALTDDDGFGFMVSPTSGSGNSRVLEFNALPYAPTNTGFAGRALHQHLMVDEGGKITLRVNNISTGVGGNDAWGATPLAQYRINASNQTYNYSYRIVPVENFDADKVMELSKTSFLPPAPASVELSTKEQFIVANFNVPNAGDETLNVLCILAMYNSDGLLIEVEQKKLSVDSGQSIESELTMPLSNNTVKAFLWDADTYIPLCVHDEAAF